MDVKHWAKWLISVSLIPDPEYKLSQLQLQRKSPNGNTHLNPKKRLSPKSSPVRRPRGDTKKCRKVQTSLMIDERVSQKNPGLKALTNYLSQKPHRCTGWSVETCGALSASGRRPAHVSGTDFRSNGGICWGTNDDFVSTHQPWPSETKKLLELFRSN